MKSSSLSSTAQGMLYVLGGASAISIAPLFVKLVDAGPSMIACHRMIWGGGVLLAIALLRKERIIPGRAMFVTLMVSALFFSGDLVSWHYSILFVGPGLATILTNFQVFFLALYSSLVMKEHMGIRLKLSIPLALIGLWLLLDVNISGFTADMGLGIFCGLLSALLYSGYVLTLRFSQTAGEKLSPIANMAVLSLLTAVFTGISGLVSGESLIISGFENNILLFFSGVGCQAIGWLLLSKGLPLLPPTQSGLIMMAQPVLAFIWDILLFKRQTSFLGYCGAVGAFAAISLGVTDKAQKPKGTQNTAAGAASAPVHRDEHAPETTSGAATIPKTPGG